MHSNKDRNQVKRRRSINKNTDINKSPEKKKIKISDQNNTTPKNANSQIVIGTPLKSQTSLTNNSHVKGSGVCKQLDFDKHTGEHTDLTLEELNNRFLDHISYLLEEMQENCYAAGMVGSNLVIASNNIGGRVKGNKSLRSTCETMNLLSEFAQDTKAKDWRQRIIKQLAHSKITSSQDFNVLSGDAGYLDSVVIALQKGSRATLKEVKQTLNSANEGVDDKKMAFYASFSAKSMKYLKKVERAIRNRPELPAVKALKSKALVVYKDQNYPLIYVGQEGTIASSEIKILQNNGGGYAVLAMGLSTNVMHAEIKVAWLKLQYLLELSPDAKVDPLDYGYIGVSKKSCHRCNAALNALNQAISDAGYQLNFKWRGTHSVNKEKAVNMPFNSENIQKASPQKIKKVLLRASEIYLELTESPIKPKRKKSKDKDGDDKNNNIEKPSSSKCTKESMYWSSASEDDSGDDEEIVATNMLLDEYQEQQDEIAMQSEQNAGNMITQQKLVKYAVMQSCFNKGAQADIRVPIYICGTFPEVESSHDPSIKAVPHKAISKAQHRITALGNGIILGMYCGQAMQWIPFAISLQKQSYRLYYRAVDGYKHPEVEWLANRITQGTLEFCLYSTVMQKNQSVLVNSMTVGLEELDKLRDFALVHIDTEKLEVEREFAKQAQFGKRVGKNQLDEAIKEAHHNHELMFKQCLSEFIAPKKAIKGMQKQAMIASYNACAAKFEALLNLDSSKYDTCNWVNAFYSSATTATVTRINNPISVSWDEAGMAIKITAPKNQMTYVASTLFVVLPKFVDKIINNPRNISDIEMTISLANLKSLEAVKKESDGITFTMLSELHDLASKALQSRIEYIKSHPTGVVHR